MTLLQQQKDSYWQEDHFAKSLLVFVCSLCPEVIGIILFLVFLFVFFYKCCSKPKNELWIISAQAEGKQKLASGAT